MAENETWSERTAQHLAEVSQMAFRNSYDNRCFKSPFLMKFNNVDKIFWTYVINWQCKIRLCCRLFKQEFIHLVKNEDKEA